MSDLVRWPDLDVSFVSLYLASDFHMGDGSARDDFAPHAARFETSLAAIPKQDIIVLVGDVVDFWRYDMPQILQRYRQVLTMLADRQAIWIAGNHDAGVLKPFVQQHLPPGFIFTKRLAIDGWYACHGDEFDLVNSRWSWIGELATVCVTAIGHTSPWLEDWLSEFPHWIKGTGRHAQASKFRKYAHAFVSDFLVNGIDCRGIVCGHTHQVAHEPGYVNTGTWATDGWTVL